VVARYSWVEVRNAAAVIAATDEDGCGDILSVLAGFDLTVPYLLVPGGRKSIAAQDVDEAFRELGWREARHVTSTITTLSLQPYGPANERYPLEEEFTSPGDQHKIDNVKNRLAVEVEWNAKDGNLDRDLAAFRTLYDLGLIDAAAIITRNHAETHYLANRLAHTLGKVAYHLRTGTEVERFNTTTTTNLERLSWRLTRGDAGGCPVLGVGIGYDTYTPGQLYELDGVEGIQPHIPAPGADELWSVNPEDNQDDV